MGTTVIDLVAESKSYVHDDNKAVQGWIDDSVWLRWLNTEYRQLYRRLIRDSATDPALSVATLALPSSTITDAEAIALVTQLDGTEQRILKPSQGALGQFYLALSAEVGDGMTWSAVAGATGGITVSVNPPATDGVYKVYYVPSPKKLVLTVLDATIEADTVYMPAGATDRLALGAARRALVRARGASRELNFLIKEADEEISFAASDRLQNGIRAKNMDWLYRGWQMRGQDAGLLMNNPRQWWWVHG